MELFRKHIDTIVILGAIISSMLWMNGKFNEIDRQIMLLEKEIAIVKTVMVMKNIMPSELASKHEKSEGV